MGVIIHKKLNRIILSIVLGAVVGVGVIGMAHTAHVFALTYQSNTDVSFTFNPTLSISLSYTNINIDNLLPGLSSESSPITVSVNSNTPYGYSLFASVGNSTDYNTTSLTHEDSNIGNNAVFTSIATNASLPELNTDNTWGYTYRTHNTNNTDNEGWSNYNGLPLYSTVDNNTSTNNPALLIDTKNPADSTESIDFKIAAKASSTQASGTYNNVINFYAVGKPEPPVSMQDTATIKAMLTNVGDEMEVMDDRDGKMYWVAKLADGNIWMTQNLDLCIGCEGTATLTSQNTDLNVSGSGAYIDGYTNIDGVITWNPVSGAITSLSTWEGSDFKPFSAEGGQIYVYTSGSTASDVAYGSLDQCVAERDENECIHYHVGNYYNWVVSVASNYFEYATVSNSICSSGWKLPSGADFKSLFYSSGIISELNSSSYVVNGFNNIRIAPLYFVRAGYAYQRQWDRPGGAVSERGVEGSYWTKNGYVAKYGYGADSFKFRDSYIHPSEGNAYGRNGGYSVRCLIR